ncbi:hypothetical protein PtA15_8A771 [Puccinia triticina]|nr:uncharacterized protein PtA15_8A771 [Puccinia triticina]WAQ87864.1 hypothetical protein PtA15_8A771 [Puccinia triticina]
MFALQMVKALRHIRLPRLRYCPVIKSTMPAVPKTTPTSRKYAAAKKSAAAKQSASAPKNRFPPGSLDRSLSDHRDPLPSADEHADLLRMGRSAPAVSNLEDAAENTATTTTRSPANDNQPIPASQPAPLNDFNNPPQKKRKRALQPDDNSDPGKRIALKGPNCWNEFFKTEEVREVFRASKGIDNEEARAKVSGIWRGKTIEEQRAYATASAKPSVSEQGVDDRCTSSNGMQPESTDRPPTGNRARRAHLESLLTAEERALDDHSDSEDTNAQSSAARNMASISETPHLRSTVSFKQDSNEVQDHMDEWLKLATRIAARHSAEFIIFGVSNHLGPHAFQFMQSTPGATPFLQFSLDSDQKKHYPARFQSYITGHTENELAALARPKKKRRVRNGMSVTDRMHQLIRSPFLSARGSITAALAHQILFRSNRTQAAGSTTVWKLVKSNPFDYSLHERNITLDANALEGLNQARSILEYHPAIHIGLVVDQTWLSSFTEPNPVLGNKALTEHNGQHPRSQIGSHRNTGLGRTRFPVAATES